MSTPSKYALLVVDVQPTFCEGGELPVAGGNAVASRIMEFVAANRSAYDMVITSQDWHIDPGDHFSDTPDFVDTWPPHGIADTPNAEVHPALADLAADLAVKKGHYEAAYSAFEGITDTRESLSDILKGVGITHLDVVGIAESHCVLQTALDGHRLGFEVRVISDLTVPVSPELGEQARGQLREEGIAYVGLGDLTYPSSAC